MKNFKLNIAYLAVFAMIFTSCSKEETVLDPDSGKAFLTFGAIVNDLSNRSQTKDHLSDFPACSDDTPAYVEIVLMQGNTEIAGTSGNPFRINLVSGKLFTSEVPELELEEGNYTLDHFAVYNVDDELIWVAPRAGSSLGGYVDNALPLNIDLRSGVKKYVEVSVLCFDDRNVNQYGYLFFELDTNVAIEYCFFANFCNEDGRHFPASYRVSIWSGTNSSGTPLYTNVVNNTGQYENGDYFATPLCFALPDNADMNQKYLYYEVTLLDWPGVYGDVEQMMVKGTLSKQDIINNFDGANNAEYQHVRFNCGNDDTNGNGGDDSDNDGVVDSEDECPDEAGPASNKGCPVDNTCNQNDASADCDNDGILNKCDTDNPNYNNFDCDGDGVTNMNDQCPNVAGSSSNNGCPVDNTCDQNNPNSDCDNDGVLNKCDTDNPNYNNFDCDGDGVTNVNDQCPNVAGPASNNGCPVDNTCDQNDPNADCDNDGVLNKCDTDNPNYNNFDCDGDGVTNVNDQCPNEAGPASNNGCPEEAFTCNVNEFDFGNLDGCQFAYINGRTDFVEITGENPWYLANQGGSAPGVGALTVRIDDNGNINVSADLSGIVNVITGYEIIVTDNSSFCEILSVDLRTTPTEIGDTFEATIDISGQVSYPFFVKVKALICAAN